MAKIKEEKTRREAGKGSPHPPTRERDTHTTHRERERERERESKERGDSEEGGTQQTGMTKLQGFWETFVGRTSFYLFKLPKGEDQESFVVRWTHKGT